MVKKTFALGSDCVLNVQGNKDESGDAVWAKHREGKLQMTVAFFNNCVKTFH